MKLRDYRCVLCVALGGEHVILCDRIVLKWVVMYRTHVRQLAISTSTKCCPGGRHT